MPKREPKNVETAYGLDIVVPGENPTIDIVAIHGLNGHREKTWRAKNGVNWLRDFVPDVLPNARVLSWGYAARTHGAPSLDKTYLYDHGVNFVTDLCSERKMSNGTRRPIIFIAHSLGGIILKSALFHAATSSAGSHPEHRSIKLSTHGIIFLGTPHQGASGAKLGQVVANVASLFIEADDRLLKRLEPDSEWLQQQQQQYATIGADFVTKFCYEEYPTPTALGHEIMVVPKQSAVLPELAAAETVVIHANHKNMVKYASKEDENFGIVTKMLQLMTQNAASAVRENWEIEARMNAARLKQGPFFLGFSLSGVSPVGHFVGREGELAEMHTALEGSTSDRRCVVIHGLGGMGKTQLAVAFLRQFHGDYSSVAWLNAASELTLLQSFAGLARRIADYAPEGYVKTAVGGKISAAMMQAAKKWLEDPRNNNWILVFDNYDHPQLGGPSQEQTAGDAPARSGLAETGSSIHPFDIRPYFPETSHGAVIITTRSSGLPLGQMIGLKKLSDASDSVQIMKFVSARQRLDKDPNVLTLAKKLDGLPLALATAGAYLGETKMTCERYLELYETAWVRLQTSSPRLLTYGDRAMYSTWRMSYEQVKTENDRAAKLLKLWAYFRSDDIWFELFQNAAKLPDWLTECTNEEEEFHRTMGLLVKYGLVEAPASDQEPGHARGYSMHECVHSWTRHVLNEPWDSDSARMALRCIASTVPESTIGPFFSLALRRAIYHATHYSMVDVRALLLHQGCDFELTSLARMCQMDGDYHTASDLYVMAFEGYEKSVGLNDSLTNEALSRLGLMYLYQGKIDYAEQTINTAFQRCASPDNLGPDDVFTLKIAMDLAGVYEVQGKVGEARKLYEDALEGFEANLGPEDDLTLRAVIFLASLCQAELERSEELFQRALSQYHKQRPRDERRIFTIYYQLSDLYKSHSLLEKSEACCQTALRGWEGLEGADAPAVVNTTYSLGTIYQQRRKLSEAKNIFEQLIESSERLGFGEHNMILDVCCRLARILLEEDRPAEAESMCLRSLSGYEARFGFNSEDALEPAILLGAIYHKLGRDEEAEAAYRRAYAACGEMWAGDRGAAAPQWAAMGFAGYGDLLRQRGDLGAAVKMYRETLAGVARFEGKDSDVNRKNEIRIQKLEARLERKKRTQSWKFRVLNLVKRFKSTVVQRSDETGQEPSGHGTK